MIWKLNLHYLVLSHCITLLRNHEQNIIAISKVKIKLLILIPNCKLNRIIDRTYRSFNVFPRTDKTYNTRLRKPEIPVFQHLIMKIYIVFQFFQRKLKKCLFFPENSENPVTVRTQKTSSRRLQDALEDKKFLRWRRPQDVMETNKIFTGDNYYIYQI